MKVIDILDRIANGEEVPHFKIFEIEYFLNDRGVLREKEEDRPSEDTRWFIDSKWLNTEVEIIEEDKKMKTIEQLECYRQYDECWVKDKFHQDQKGSLVDEIIIDKINEIIDKLNKGE